MDIHCEKKKLRRYTARKGLNVFRSWFVANVEIPNPENSVSLSFMQHVRIQFRAERAASHNATAY